MRKVIFFVQTMVWDNIYSCYTAKVLFQSESYEDCNQFCLSYNGEEETVFIQKAFLK
jgi:hypothetical protein